MDSFPDSARPLTSSLLDIARGAATRLAAVQKFGRNPDIDSAAEDLWSYGGAYNWLTTARLHNLVSDSDEDNDQSNAATGTVTIVDWAKAILAAATGSITYGAPSTIGSRIPAITACNSCPRR